MSETQPDYFRLRALGLQRHDEDDFSTSCFELGAAGVAEDLKFKQMDLCYEPDVVETPEFDLNVYFTEAPREDLVLQLQSRFPKVRLEMVQEQNKDWLAEWKKGFVPFCFAGPFWVVPSWCPAPPEVAGEPWRQILIEPGMAFGTGTHETTRIAAGFVIEEMANKRATPPSVLDVGTGTGILALIAKRMGAGKVVGLDNDPEACRTARENLERNGSLELIQIPDSDVSEEKEPYDIVIANIIDGVLMVLRDHLTAALKPGGRMILSGVLVEREDTFYREFTAATGMKMITKRTDGEWSGAILEKV